MTLEELSVALGRPLSIDPGPPDNPSPWYVQVMLGVCAWIAGLLLIVFLILGVAAAAHGNDYWGVAIVLGVLACSGAALVYAAVSESSAFGSQFALAVSIAGQTGIAIGLGGATSGPLLTLWGTFVVELVMMAIIRNRLHRILTTLFAVIAWALAVHASVYHDLPGIRIWGGRQEQVFDMSGISIAIWFATWAPIAFAAFWLVKNEGRWMADGLESWLRPITYGLLAALAIAPLVTHPATFWMALGHSAARELTDGSQHATALWPLLAMFLSVLALASAFTICNRALMGLAILFGLLEIGGFYYVLGATLLVKSVIMIALGVAMLGAAQFLAKERAA
jgi:hypothetical protein